MTRVIIASALLLCSSVFAQAAASVPAGGSPSSGVPLSQFETLAAMNLFVSTTGNDSNSCTSSGAGACLTIQGALNKVPKIIRHAVNISVGTGNFAGAYFDGFSIINDLNAPTTGAYVEIDGTTTAFAVATGTSTGTATAGSAGSGSTFGTLTDGAQTWTANDLRGKLLHTIAGTGSGQFRIIEANTGTVITVTGTMTAPANGTTYEILDWGTVINSGVAVPAMNSFTATSATQSAFRFGAMAKAEEFVGTLRWLKMTTAQGVNTDSDGTIFVAECDMATTSNPFAPNGGGRLRVDRTWLDLPSLTTGSYVTTIGAKLISSTNNLYRASGGAGTAVNVGGAFTSTFTSSGDAFENLTNGVLMRNGSVSGSRFLTVSTDCISTQQVGLTFIGSPAAIQISGPIDMNTCGIGLHAAGGAIWFGATGTAVTGSSNTLTYKVEQGGTIQENSTSTVSGTTDINLDGDTYTVAQLRAATPSKSISRLDTQSRISESQ